MVHTEEQKQNFKLEDFEGPLDLLLFLVKKNEVNIYDIPISLITEQFLGFLNLSTHVNLDHATEFYQMAATLLYIKSRTLLPIETDFDEELEDPRQELVEKLIEYQKYKRLADLMAVNESAGDWIYERKKRQVLLPFDQTDDLFEKLEVWDLLKTFSNLMKSLSPERIIDLYEEVSINEKISLINELLENKDFILFTDIITRPDSILDLVCSFLAILEMVKAKKIAIFQNRLFGDIQIRAQQPAAEEN